MERARTQMKRRCVITGMGAITPIGNSVEEFWKSVKEGVVGIDEITYFDTSDYSVKLAAQVKGFVAKDRMDGKASRRMETFSQYAVAASLEAVRQAGIEVEAEDPYRCGVIIGSGVGSLQVIEKEYTKIVEKGPSRVHPLMVPLMISNMAAGNVSIQLGFKGKCTEVVTACATGTNSIGDALRAIQYNDLDVCVAGGTESSICPTGVSGFSALTALSTATDPKRASIPFDVERDGFVIGEGAGVVVLEELEHAKQRGATILAEIVGYGSTADAYHITSPSEDGSGAAKAMSLALEEAEIAPQELDYINAHGTSTHHNDMFETRAIKTTFGEHAKAIHINSTKSMIGHLLGAAGGVECIVCVNAIQDGFVHQTMGSEKSDPECDLDYTFGKPVQADIKYAMSNSLGFGGHNASIVLKRYEK